MTMQMVMCRNAKIHGLFLLCLLVLAGCKVESHEEKQKRKEVAREAVHSEMQPKVAEITTRFAQTHNGDATWKDTLKERPFTTYALQKALIRSDQRPILAGGILFDIEQRDKGVVVWFRVTGIAASIMDKRYVLMELRCPRLTDAEVSRLKLKEFYAWETEPDYLIAARIDEVVQSHQFLQTVDKTPNSTSLETAFVEYVAKGECVGLESVEALKAEYSEKLNASQLR